jgi:hypothetical protein
MAAGSLRRNAEWYHLAPILGENGWAQDLVQVGPGLDDTEGAPCQESERTGAQIEATGIESSAAVRHTRRVTTAGRANGLPPISGCEERCDKNPKNQMPKEK